MTVDLGTFASRLQACGAMSAEDWAAWQTRRPDLATLGPEELSRELVRGGRLTEYQAQLLLADRPERLRFGKYLVLEKIGEGGMGIVFRAECRNPRTIVALKALHPHLLRDATAVRRFRREVETVSSLSHPHIVAALDSGEEDGVHYFVMEYVTGETLSKLVKSYGTVPVGTAINCVLQAAKGLHYAHEHGVVHRDIKPSNLLLDRHGNIRILDLGLARVVQTFAVASDDTETEITRTGTVMGTVDYMAPEQALNARNADHRSDIYSLGCTMYFLLTGHPVYDGETVMEKLVAHRENPIPSLRQHRDDVPDAVERVLQTAVAKSRDERYQSMRELIDDLEACRGEHGLTWLIQKVTARRRRQ